MPEQESLREQIKQLRQNNRSLGSTLYHATIDDLMHLIEQDRERAVREARIDEARQNYKLANEYRAEGYIIIGKRLEKLTQERSEQ